MIINSQQTRPSMFEALLRKKSRTLQKPLPLPEPEVKTTWNTEDQLLISKLTNCKDERPVWQEAIEQYKKMILLGADTEMAQSRHLQNSISKMLQFFEHEQQQAALEQERIAQEDKILNDERNINEAPSLQNLIMWFVENVSRLPTTPFRLSNFESIANPIKFYDSIQLAISLGEKGYEYKSGVLCGKIEKLKNYLEHSN